MCGHRVAALVTGTGETLIAGNRLARFLCVAAEALVAARCGTGRTALRADAIGTACIACGVAHGTRTTCVIGAVFLRWNSAAGAIIWTSAVVARGTAAVAQTAGHWRESTVATLEGEEPSKSGDQKAQSFRSLYTHHRPLGLVSESLVATVLFAESFRTIPPSTAGLPSRSWRPADCMYP